MASPQSPPAEAILCVHVPWREGKERLWQAIELLRHTPPSPQPVPAPVPSKRLPPRGAGGALYARGSTEKHERAETVARQVDLLYKAAAAAGSDMAPTNVLLDEGVRGTRLDRPALDR
jgi:hypothetical protein